jgi:hypothetical protein
MRSRRGGGVAGVEERWGEGRRGEGCTRSGKLGFCEELDAAVCGCGSISGGFKWEALLSGAGLWNMILVACEI